MSDVGKAPEQRPELPHFWDKRFSEGVTPWDAGRVPAALARFVARHPEAPVTLIPGCGSAWEAAHLAERGWPVVALDFSAAAIARAGELLGNWPGQLVCADFFSYRPDPACQLIYERAFLCALPRKLWPAWGRRMAELLPAGGLLAGFFFLCDQLKGPPFGIARPELDALLTPAFDLIEEGEVDDSIPVFAGRERWMVWRRRPDGRMSGERPA